jgi:small subunit ribosomal protein S14
MAKTSHIEKLKRRRKMVAQYSARREALKKVVMSKTAPIEERFEATIKLAELPRNSAKNRIKNRCEMTGRPRAYYRKLRMSRIAIRDLASRGLIPGMVKSSW